MAFLVLVLTGAAVLCLAMFFRTKAVTVTGNQRYTDEELISASGIQLEQNIFSVDRERTAAQVFVPLTVGGGIRTLDDFQRLLRAGADKISVNSAAVKDESLISRAAERFGSQCVVLAIDARRRVEGWYEVVTAGGRTPTGLDAVAWARRGQALGAGEILLTSMDADGTKAGFDLDMTRSVTEAVSVPVIASGGCGSLEHFAQVFQETDCDAALAASLFHFGGLTVPQVKDFLRGRNIPVRR